MRDLEVGMGNPVMYVIVSDFEGLVHIRTLHLIVSVHLSCTYGCYTNVKSIDSTCVGIYGTYESHLHYKVQRLVHEFA